MGWIDAAIFSRIFFRLAVIKYFVVNSDLCSSVDFERGRHIYARSCSLFGPVLTCVPYKKNDTNGLYTPCSMVLYTHGFK